MSKKDIPPDYQKILKWFSLRRIMVPVVIGIAISAFLIFKDIGSGAKFSEVSYHAFFWMFIALLLQIVRDLAYMVRIRFLTDNKLTWRDSFQIIMLWEFASSVTPSVVGGTSIAFFIMYREGFSAGRSTAIVIITAMLDELFYIIIVPLVFIIAGRDYLFPDFTSGFFNLTPRIIFIIGYLFICFLTLIIVFGVFISPQTFKKLLVSIFSIFFLKRWRHFASNMGDEIIVTSKEMRSKKFSFWLKAWIITFFSWTARFMVVNALILSVNPVKNHFLIYARQLVMWVILLISPTPGSSGTAEYLFPQFLKEFFVQGSPDFIALIWRLMSYYPYLIAGAIVLPFWIRRTIVRHKR